MAQPTRTPVGFETIYQFAASYGSGVGYGSDLVSDGHGGFFGNTIEGGPAVCPDPYGCGTIYHLAQPAASGDPWTMTMLYNFTGSPDGQNPGGPVMVASSGVLYGITSAGGTASCGTAYSLTPPATPGGAWTESVLYSFAGGADGCYPASVALGQDGVLYGVTVQGANAGCGYPGSTCGTAFALSPPSTPGMPWTNATIYSFSGDYYSASASSIIVGPNQVLYGTIGAGLDPCFDQECGAVFSLTPPSSPGSAWTETILHSFVGWPDDGNSPNASLALGPNGELYGTTYLGESHPCGDKHAGCGTVFELAPPVAPDGTWTETLLHTFPASPAPSHPQNGVVLGKNGELYGTTPFGGVPGCQDDFGCGAIFKLTPPAAPGGAWTETVLHHFTGGADGAEPYTTLVVGKDGALYGTSAGFNSSWPGTVFLIRNP
ncbi:MAG: choice-of-anchor tandem repeat GloVer-containing protein [Bryobacteraceae bacterium]